MEELLYIDMAKMVEMVNSEVWETLSPHQLLKKICNDLFFTVHNFYLKKDCTKILDSS